jgi:2-polyprenyl-3-methyl-5-hydroxy-6-metoxy-1,4-benzoquinol methylase
MDLKKESAPALATAHQAWDSLWGTEAGRKDWIAAERDVQDLEKKLASLKVSRVLDLGCGIGRHSLFFASKGYQVFSIDASSKAVDFTQNAAREAGLSIDVRQSPMTTLPFEDHYFDYVLAWNVIYHGDPDTVRTVLSEVVRVLRQRGIFQGTMLTKRNAYYGKGQKVAPDTYVNDEEDEKKHAHFYCNAKELTELLHNFEILSLHQKRQIKPGSYHWNYVVERI